MQELQSLDGLLALYVRERDPSDDMVRQLGVVLRSFCQFTEVHSLDGIRRGGLLDWKAHLLKVRKVAPATWNNYWRHLKVLLNFAGEMGWQGGAELRGVRRIPEPQKRKRTLGTGDAGKLVSYLGKPEQGSMPGWFWAAAINVLHYTGMRRRQLVGLQWGDIDRQAGTIHLRAETSKTGKEWSIPLAEPLRVVLDEIARHAKWEQRRQCRADDQVFNVTLFNPRYRGKSMTVGHVSAAFRRIREDTGINVSAHRFRHTFATQLAQSGKIRDLQQMMGHSDVRTTLGYVQPDMDLMRQMLAGLCNI